MKYYDEHHTEQRLSETAAQRLAYVAHHSPVGRLSVDWRSNDVRALEDRGLWDVDWVEPGGHERKGGWVITGLTEVGRNVLRDWNLRMKIRADKGDRQ